MKGRPPCEHKVFTAEVLEDMIVTNAKDFLSTLDKEKLMHSHEDTIREQEELFGERLKKIVRDVGQKERELKKLKDEVIKVLMGESGFTQSLLTEMITTKEAELAELAQRQTATQAAVDDLAATIRERKEMARELETWAERFDTQGTMDKKAMLINVIERATVNEEDIEVVYRIKLENMGEEDNTPPDGGKYMGGEGDSADGLLSPPFSIFKQGNDENGGFDTNTSPFLAERFVQSCQQAMWSIFCPRRGLCAKKAFELYSKKKISTASTPSAT